MSNFETLRRSAVKAVAGGAITLFAAATAFAQSTVLVVDTSRVYVESQVGQHIERQITTMAETSRTQLEAQGTPLQTSGRTLMTQMDGKSREQISADAALVSQLQMQQRGEQQLQQDAAIAQREIQLAKIKAVQLVDAKVSAIIRTIVTERNADIVIDRANVIYGAPADITDTVLSRLNSQMQTVPVTRESLPQQPG